MEQDLFLLGFTEHRGAWRPKRVAPSDILRRHLICLGRTRSGKTAACLGYLLQAIRGRAFNVVILDMKGELTDQLRDFAAVLSKTEAAFAADRFVTLSAFSGFGFGLNPLLMKGVDPGVHAHHVASLMADLTTGGGVGLRMEGILSGLVRAVSPLRGSLLDCRRILQEDAFRLAVADRTQDAETAFYIRNVLPKEPSGSREAVRSRIDYLLSHDGIRKMFLADHCVSGADFLESPVTVLSVGGAPLGLPALTRFMGGLLFLLLTGGVFSRVVTQDTRPCVILVDEWQEAARFLASDIERVLSLAAFKRVALHLTNQTIAQIESVSHALVASVMTNVGSELLFAPSNDDLRHVESLLPVTGRAVDPMRPDRCLTEEAELRALKRRLVGLPPRHAVYVDRVGGRAEVLRTPTLPFERVIAEARALPAGVLEAWTRGRLGVPLAELREAKLDIPDVPPPAPSASPSANPTPSFARRVPRKGTFKLPS